MIRLRTILTWIFLLSPLLSARGDEVALLEDGRFATSPSHLRATVSSRKRIIINSAVNLKGKITVRAENIAEAILEYRKIIKTASQSEAIDFAAAINISLDKSPSGTRLLLQAPNPAPWTGTAQDGLVEATLRLPEDSRIEIDALYFDFDIVGPFRSVVNKSSLGRLNVKNITERLELGTSNRDISAEQITGAISISTAHADIRVNDLVSDKMAAQIKNEKGNIFIERASGMIDVQSSYGKIRLDEMIFRGGNSRIMGQYSPIRLKLVNMEKGYLTVSNNNSDIEILMPDSISVKCLLSVGPEGEISVERLPAIPTYVSSNSLGFISAEGASRADISIAGDGNIYLKGTGTE
jgi:hypothetical protein